MAETVRLEITLMAFAELYFPPLVSNMKDALLTDSRILGDLIFRRHIASIKRVKDEGTRKEKKAPATNK